MADFSIISDAGAAVLKLLRDNLCPEPIPSPEAISMVSPNDKNGDFQLGVFLYDIKELAEYKQAGPVYKGDSRQNPPKPLALSYLLFVNSKAQIAAGAEMEQRIFGRAIQALMDNSLLRMDESNPYLPEEEEQTAISLLNLSFEDKSKIWTALSVPYQLGVHFSVAPLLLAPRKQVPVSRVVTEWVRVEQKEPEPARPRPKRR